MNITLSKLSQMAQLTHGYQNLVIHYLISTPTVSASNKSFNTLFEIHSLRSITCIPR
jgi:hypothetical protein